MSATMCLSSSSWLSKYRYRAGAVIPISRAIARSVTAALPCCTRIRRAVCLISSVVAARTRSRLLGAWTMTTSLLAGLTGRALRTAGAGPRLPFRTMPEQLVNGLDKHKRRVQS